MKQKPYEAIMKKNFIVPSGDPLITKKYEWYKSFKPDKNAIQFDSIKLEESIQ